MYDFYDEPQYFNPEDFLEQYEVSIRELLVNATNSKIKETIEELARLKTDYAELEKEKNELRYELNNINPKHKSELEESYKTGYKDAERKLGLGFAVNDTVYYIDAKIKHEKCDMCNGNYEIKTEVLGKEVKVSCPHCSYGKKSITTYLPVKDTIRSLKFYISREDRDRRNSPAELKLDWEIKAYLDKYDYEKDIDKLYLVLEDCQKVCDEKNSKNSNL